MPHKYYTEDEYRELLQKSWDESLDIIYGRGEIPPWVETDTLLNQDEVRLLSVIGDSYLEGRNITVNYPDTDNGLFTTRARRVSTLTHEAGFNAEVNCTAVVRRCLQLGYIERIVSASKSYLRVTDRGYLFLDSIEADQYWEDMEDGDPP